MIARAAQQHRRLSLSRRVPFHVNISIVIHIHNTIVALMHLYYKYTIPSIIDLANWTTYFIFQQLQSNEAHYRTHWSIHCATLEWRSTFSVPNPRQPDPYYLTSGVVSPATAAPTPAASMFW